MPEEIGLETKELQEKLEHYHEAHKHGGHNKEDEEHAPWTRWMSLSTGLLAVLAAVAALMSGSLVNEALAERNVAVLKQEQATDQWAYYQAKGIKGNTARQTADLLAAAHASASRVDHYNSEADSYNREQKDIQREAKALEDERDAKMRESALLMEQHHTFAYCVTFTQVAIALSAIAALTRMRSIWYISLAVGLAGLVFFGIGFMHIRH